MELLERVSDFTNPDEDLFTGGDYAPQPIAYADRRLDFYTDEPQYWVSLCGAVIFIARRRERAESVARSAADRHGWDIQNLAIERY